MHTISTIKHWTQRLHEDGANLIHRMPQVLHEKAFWAITFILAGIVLLFYLLLWLGNETTIDYTFSPYPML